MGMLLPKPCVVCQQLTEPGESRCRKHAIVRSTRTTRGARAAMRGRLLPCAICKKVLPSSALELDHRVPLFAGGKDVRENLQALCVACHAIKTQDDVHRRH